MFGSVGITQNHCANSGMINLKALEITDNPGYCGALGQESHDNAR